MFKAIKRNVFVRVPYITSRKVNFKKKKRPHTQSATDIKSHKLERERRRGGGFAESAGVGVQGLPRLAPGGTCALGALGTLAHSPSHSSPPQQRNMTMLAFFISLTLPLIKQ